MPAFHSIHGGFWELFFHMPGVVGKVGPKYRLIPGLLAYYVDGLSIWTQWYPGLAG